jgi:hypothetical protein
VRQEAREVVREDVSGEVPIGKVEFLRPFGDAGLQRALDGVPGEIVRARSSPGVEEGLGVQDAVVGELLEIGPVHKTRRGGTM